jgi:HPt (histidine-containing phosphotransfer) domain-containing protein
MIVALTANVSEEDRSRYLACGMDAFITKPIDDAQLHFHITRAIERQLQRGIELARMPEPAARAPSTAELDAMFDVRTGQAEQVAAAQNAPRRAGDFKERLRNAFLADLPRRRVELDTALAQGDHDTAGRVLHGLKGSAGYLGEARLREVCAELEGLADAGQLDAVRTGLPRLLDLLARFEAETA